MGFQVVDSSGKLKVSIIAVDAASITTGVLATARGGTSVNIASAALPLGSGQIAFPATQNASSDANTLDDYEEGTWTPVDASGASLSFSNNAGQYVKIGKIVNCSGRCDYPVTASGLAAVVGGLPFTCDSGTLNAWAGFFSYTNFGAYVTMPVLASTTTVAFYDASGVAITNATMSGKILTYTIIYRTSA
jgi:hypothetical protein